MLFGLALASEAAIGYVVCVCLPLLTSDCLNVSCNWHWIAPSPFFRQLAISLNTLCSDPSLERRMREYLPGALAMPYVILQPLSQRPRPDVLAIN